MIKHSLAELRAKLDNMKRNKMAVENGISGYESKYNQWTLPLHCLHKPFFAYLS